MAVDVRGERIRADGHGGAPLAQSDELARAEPKRLRYCLLHTAAQITRSGRRTWLRHETSVADPVG